jgi:hypothetical protein
MGTIHASPRSVDILWIEWESRFAELPAAPVRRRAGARFRVGPARDDQPAEPVAMKSAVGGGDNASAIADCRGIVLRLAPPGSEDVMPDSEYCTDFEPETQSMVEALRAAIGVLRLSNRRPDLAVFVTRKIIELAKASERETERLAALTQH